MSEKLTDWRGNSYGVGDLIVYATRQSSNQHLTTARVLEIIPGEPGSWSYAKQTASLRVMPEQTSGYSLPDKPVVLSALRNVLLVEKS